MEYRSIQYYSGYSGWSGLSGMQGFSGQSGWSGWSGMPGEYSASGFSGYSGWSGWSGWSGMGHYTGTAYFFSLNPSDVSGYMAMDASTITWNQNTYIFSSADGMKLLFKQITNIGAPGMEVQPPGNLNLGLHVQCGNTDPAYYVKLRVEFHVYGFFSPGDDILISTLDDVTLNTDGQEARYYAKKWIDFHKVYNSDSRVIAVVYGYTNRPTDVGVKVWFDGFSYFQTPFLPYGWSGWSGWSGASGASGISGWSGMPGEYSVSGLSGWSGQSGLSGWSGWSGGVGFYEYFSHLSKRTSGHYVKPVIGTAARSSVLMSNSTLYATPQLVAKGFVCDAVRFRVTALYSSTARNVVVGIYDDNDGVPGNLLGQTSEQTSQAIGVHTALLQSPVTLESNNLYWVVMLISGMTYIMNAPGSQFLSLCDQSDSSMAGSYYYPVGYAHALTYTTTLPSTFPVTSLSLLLSNSTLIYQELRIQ